MIEKLFKIIGKHSHATKDIALVLSSGGARGLAHIGAIEVLEEQGYHITSIAGCSIGALIGGVYAAGKLQEFREWMKGIDRKKMMELTDSSLSLNHFVKSDRIIETIMGFVPDVAIEDLPIPYCGIATDWAEGLEIVFRTGSLFEAIRASISLPSFYKPIHQDGMILIDGGVINPIPLNRVERHKGDLLMGVDVSGYVYKAREYKKHDLSEHCKNDNSLTTKILEKLMSDNIDFDDYAMLSRTSSLIIRQNSILMTQLIKPDILVDIQMSCGGLDYYKSEELIDIGRQKALKAISEYEHSSMQKN